MGVTLIEPGISDKELRTVINTNDIFCITELPDNPEATMVVFHKASRGILEACLSPYRKKYTSYYDNSVTF